MITVRTHHNIYKSDESFAFIIDRIKHPKANRSFLKDYYTDPEAWKAENRAFVKQGMSFEEERAPLDMRVHATEAFDGYTRKTITFGTVPGCRVSAYLLIPDHLKEPAPAILALHDHSGHYYWGKEKLTEHHEKLPFVEWFQEFRYGERGYASHLARQGYVVLCPDAIGWGDRCSFTSSWIGANYVDMAPYDIQSETYVDEFDKAWAHCEERFAATIAFAGRHYIGVMVRDDMGALDLLSTLPEVDASRIGCVGLSMGGYRTALLTALDERIKASCIVGYMTKYSDTSPNHGQPNTWALPGVYNELPYEDLVALAMPRPLLALNCENDKLFDLSTQVLACRQVEMAYEKAGAGGNFQWKGFPVGHQFGYDMQEYAFDWFKKVL